MPDPQLAALEEQLQSLFNEFQDVLEWKWDGRFKTALAEFDASRKGEVLRVLGKFLATTWDSASIKDAPDAVQQVKKSLGGLMPGQMLLVSDVANAALIFCAWWPWGNGTKISIRVAPFSVELSEEDAATLVSSFRSCFGV